MSVMQYSRSAIGDSAPRHDSPAGSGSLSGHTTLDAHATCAGEGQTSPQAKGVSLPNEVAPAGASTSHGQRGNDAHGVFAVAAHLPGGQCLSDAQWVTAAGDSGAGQPAAIREPTPKPEALLADPFLALSADVLDDMEKVRIANENRLRQLTRSTEDSDGETRGFGLDENHPDVARLAALVQMLADAEHKAELNLGRLMRAHPLGPWVKRTTGLGEKQMARLIASIGDPYVRPEITREDGTLEPSRPRTVSELWAYAGYHVIRTPVSGQFLGDTQVPAAADGPNLPAGQRFLGTHPANAGGDQSGHPGHGEADTQSDDAGVAPKRARGQKANWSATAKMRAYLVAVSCMKCLESPYRKVYDDAREHHAEALHNSPCVRCGPAGKPALTGSPLSDGHKHARALRKVAKEVLKDLWRESRRLHEGADAA